jgi:hypothetical protein
MVGCNLARVVGRLASFRTLPSVLPYEARGGANLALALLAFAHDIAYHSSLHGDNNSLAVNDAS